MNRQSIRIVAGANLVAGCLLLQGCGMFGKKPAEQSATTIPENAAPVSTQAVEQVSSLPPAEPVPVEPIAAPLHSTTSYTIQKGDTISSVAYKYNLRWQDVVAVNPGISPNRLRVGQVIQLPGQLEITRSRSVPSVSHHKHVSAPKTVAPKTSLPKVSGAGFTDVYVVKSGDSLSLIAHRHGTKTAALREANGLKNDKLVVGQKLKIPASSKKAGSEVSSAKKGKTVAAAPKTTAPKTSKKAAAEKAAKPAETAAPASTPPPPAVESAPAAAPAAPTAAAPTTAAAPAAPAAAESSTQTYTVKEGEDLYAVAIRWGVSPSDLKALNNLTSTELKAGTVLKIPGAQ